MEKSNGSRLPLTGERNKNIHGQVRLAWLTQSVTHEGGLCLSAAFIFGLVVCYLLVSLGGVDAVDGIPGHPRRTRAESTHIPEFLKRDDDGSNGSFLPLSQSQSGSLRHTRSENSKTKLGRDLQRKQR